MDKKYRYLSAITSGSESVEFDKKAPKGSAEIVCTVDVRRFLVGIYTHPCSDGENHTLDGQTIKEIMELIRAERNAVKYSGKVKTLDDWGKYGFNLDQFLAPSDEVDEDIIYEQMNCVSPHMLKGGYLQVGEPYRHMNDQNECCRPVFATFHMKRGTDKWLFAGYCFSGEDENRVVEINVETS